MEKEKSKAVEEILGYSFERIEERFNEHDATGYVQELFDFLCGEFHPWDAKDKDSPILTKEQTWRVIYCLQEYFGLLDDRFELCRKCGLIYDSHEEGENIHEESEYVEYFDESEYGTYCGDCLPNIETEE